jgi:D-psicose/D-tagatose/L-ribulose 3-epimerase
MPWHEIATALHEIDYDGTVVMEPFVRMGGKVGQDIKIWHELNADNSEAKMDDDARKSLLFERAVLG